MKFNVNNCVKVKLTDWGREVHRANHTNCWKDSEKKPVYRPPLEDDSGYSRWQMWELMCEFGSHTGLCLPPCFDTEIIIGEE